MENRKILVEKELKLEKKRIDQEIELLKQEKEKYGFDYNAMEKTLGKVKYITISNVAIASLINIINPFVGTFGYLLFAGLISNFEEMLIEKHYIKGDKLGLFSSKDKIASNYKKILDIDLEIEKANFKNRIIDRAIDINKEGYKFINKDLSKDNKEEINQIILQNLSSNDDFLNGREIDYSGRMFVKSAVSDMLGGGVVCLGLIPSIMGFGVGMIGSFAGAGFPHVRSLSIVRESDDMIFKRVNVIKECKNVKEEFLDEKKNGNNKDISELDLLYIIEDEAYKKLDEYNNNLESTIRNRKVDEYYKKKEDIIRYLNSKDENKVESKNKILQKVY